MPRLTIEEFRARLAGRGAAGPLLRAYRELGRRPELRAARGRNVEWNPWSGADTGTRASTSARFPDWRVWTGAGAA